jgi:hypothetical protein
MKNALFFSVLSIFAIACGSTSSDNAVKDFIPGTYVRSFNESIYDSTSVGGDDTLRIKKQTESGSETFQIDRSTRIARIKEGQKQPDKYETETWTGTYHESDKTLFMANTNGTIAFDVKNKLLKMGKMEFKKIE